VNISYGVLYAYCIVFMKYMRRVCIWCPVHDGYAVSCTDNAMYMLGMQCYVQVVLCACCTCDVTYTWCGLHDCMSGDVCMWCCVHVVQVVLCAGGVVYMSCMWCGVHLVLHICHACGTVYMWYCVHVVQVVWCTCCTGGIMYM